MPFLNYVLIITLIVGMSVVLYLFYKMNSITIVEETLPDNKKFSLERVSAVLLQKVDDLIDTNVEALNHNRKVTEQLMETKRATRISREECCQGKAEPRQYMLDLYYGYLIASDKLKTDPLYGFNEDTMNYMIPFDKPEKLSAAQKFHILLYCYTCTYGAEGFAKFIEAHGLCQPKMDDDYSVYYNITAEEIEEAYRNEHRVLENLTYEHKVRLCAWFAYQQLPGNRAIDDLLYQNIDGISCGVSGIPDSCYGFLDAELDTEDCDYLGDLPRYSYNSIWVNYAGKEVRMTFLGFYSEDNLETVCDRLYKFDARGQLNDEDCLMITRLANNDRLAIARPKSCASWAFVLRKNGTALKKRFEDQLDPSISQTVSILMKLFVRGYRTIVITGGTNTGKSTILRGLIRYIPKTVPVRIQEKELELIAYILYLDMNITAFQTTPGTSGQEITDFLKKFNTAINIVSEIAEATEATYFIQSTQVGSYSGISTNHANTTKDLIDSISAQYMSIMNFTKSEAVKTVAKAIDVDFHMGRDAFGNRYLERISLILPKEKPKLSEDLNEAWLQYINYQINDDELYTVIDLVSRDPDTEEYYFNDVIPDSVIQEMLPSLGKEDRLQLEELQKEMYRQVAERKGGATVD